MRLTSTQTKLIVTLVVMVMVVGLTAGYFRISNSDMSNTSIETHPMVHLPFFEGTGGVTTYVVGVNLSWEDMPGRQLVKFWVFAQANFTLYSDATFATKTDTYWTELPPEFLIISPDAEPQFDSTSEFDTYTVEWNDTQGSQSFSFDRSTYIDHVDVDYSHPSTDYNVVEDDWSWLGWFSLEELRPNDGLAFYMSFTTDLLVVNSIVEDNYDGMCGGGICYKVSQIRLKYIIEYFTVSNLYGEFLKHNVTEQVGGDSNVIDIFPVAL